MESEFSKRYKKPYHYRSKYVKDGTADKIWNMRKQGMTFQEIGKSFSISRIQASQIYYKIAENKRVENNTMGIN